MAVIPLGDSVTQATQGRGSHHGVCYRSLHCHPECTHYRSPQGSINSFWASLQVEAVCSLGDSFRTVLAWRSLLLDVVPATTWLHCWFVSYWTINIQTELTMHINSVQQDVVAHFKLEKKYIILCVYRSLSPSLTIYIQYIHTIFYIRLHDTPYCFLLYYICYARPNYT